MAATAPGGAAPPERENPARAAPYAATSARTASNLRFGRWNGIE